MKYFVTKYALSAGEIQERDCRQFGSFAQYEHHQFKIGKDAFEDRADAVTAARDARDKRIASLRRQIVNLEKLTFE